ncbi:hypothetical protein N7537_004154 [Penicillium hordei]|uniref:Uncharacterized protein n=1 Tax=Penicillium hordei TaxID=40994 RepID=A0AAD6EAQ1_9EURO|nr:uncharacterized protein N7537_004154 [Penicillium hordei]KAJ5607535.1 hypothetical protein N7537_004154 [Penicillium hordei]
MRAVYPVATKDIFRVGLILGTVSSLGAVLCAWQGIKTKRDDGNDERSSDHELELVAEVRREDK